MHLQCFELFRLFLFVIIIIIIIIIINIISCGAATAPSGSLRGGGRGTLIRYGNYEGSKIPGAEQSILAASQKDINLSKAREKHSITIT